MNLYECVKRIKAGQLKRRHRLCVVQIGACKTSLAQFCSTMGLPPPVTKNPYAGILRGCHTEYVKADPIQINYGNYTKFNPILFQEELRDCLYQDADSMKTFSNFQETLCMLLNKHAPLKKKYLRANDSSFMTKPLQKLIMNRSRCKNKYLKNRTVK